MFTDILQGATDELSSKLVTTTIYRQISNTAYLQGTMGELSSKLATTPICRKN